VTLTFDLQVSYLVTQLEFNIPFSTNVATSEMKDQDRVESYRYPVQEGQRYIDLNPCRLFSAATQQWKGIERLVDPSTRGPRDSRTPGLAHMNPVRFVTEWLTPGMAAPGMAGRPHLM